jgi:hypothetical protein
MRHCRKASEKPFVVACDRINPGLLQHDLG